jgi:hypothetical protein
MCIKLAERKFFHETAGSATVKKTQTFPGPERADLNQGSWNDCQINSSKRNPFRKRQGTQSRKNIPQFEQTISELGNLLLCTGLSDRRFFQEAAENAMRIASNNETVHDGLYG